MNIQDVVVFDVRAPEEHEQFWVLPKVDLYMNMYADDFFGELWKLDKSKKYLIYCWHANRTKFLLNYMSNSGFEYIKDLEGGIDGWVEAWYKLVKKET
jgi:rhodanese-related sulfurtransferase